MKSSWSNDVWTMRYYQGKGDGNFEYTPGRGIVPIGTNGMPPPHEDCQNYKTEVVGSASSAGKTTTAGVAVGTASTNSVPSSRTSAEH